MFWLGYDRMNVWEKFIELYDWCDGCKDILNYFNSVNFKITNLLLCIKKEKIINNYFLHVLVN